MPTRRQRHSLDEPILVTKPFSIIRIPGAAANWQPRIFVVTALLLGLAAAKLPPSTTAVALLVAALAVAVVVRPVIGLILALLAGPFGALENVLFSSPMLDSGQLLLLLTLAAWLGQGIVRRRINLRHSRILVPLLLFIGIGLLSLLTASSVPDGMKELLKWIEIALLIWLVSDVEAEGPRDRGRRSLLVVSGLLLAGLSQALIGIWQFGLRGTGPEHFIILGRFYRAYGTFEQPNPFGGFINLTALMSLGITIGLAAAYWQQRQERANGVDQTPYRFLSLPLSPLNVIASGAIAAISVTALMMSWSRGAWLGFVAGLAALLFFYPRKRWQGAALLAAAAVVGSFLLLAGIQANLLPATIVDRFTDFGQGLQLDDVRGVDISDTNYAVVERVAHWQAALNMARDKLWLGVGFGNYASAYPNYALLNWPDPLGHAHNYYLNLLAEVGILGLAAYCLFWIMVIRQTAGLINTLAWPDRGIALGLMAAWFGLSIHHLVDNLFVNNIYIHLGCMFGLLQLLEMKRDKVSV